MKYSKTRFELVALFYSNGSEVIEVVIDGRFLETRVKIAFALLMIVSLFDFLLRVAFTDSTKHALPNCLETVFLIKANSMVIFRPEVQPEHF